MVVPHMTPGTACKMLDNMSIIDLISGYAELFQITLDAQDVSGDNLTAALDAIAGNIALLEQELSARRYIVSGRDFGQEVRNIDV